MGKKPEGAIMKKLFLAVLVILAIVSFASFTFAEDDVNVDVSNESTNNLTATGGNAQQDQNQIQDQNQNQTACGGAGGRGGSGGEGGNAYANSNSNAEINHSGNADVTISGVEGGQGGEGGKVVDSGNSKADANAKNETSVNGVKGEIKNTYVNEDKRGHINAPTGPSGNFLGANFIASKDWQMVICQPLFRSFSVEELEVMSDGAGGWFSSGIEKSLRMKKVSSYDEALIVRLDFIPAGPNDRIIGEYEYESEEPMPLGKALAHVLIEAKEDLNVHRVVVWTRIKGEVQNTGLSIGSGVAGSRLWGPDSDGTAGAIGLGGLIGTTTARTQEVYGIRVWALNDGSIDPPEGVEVCGLTISATASESEGIVEEEIPSQKPACDADEIRREIEALRVKISNCKNWGIDNMRLRFEKAGKNIDLALCTGENGYFSEAIKDYQIAEKNYLNGKDISANQAEADNLIAQVYYNWAGCIYEINGPNVAMTFAQDKNISSIPKGFERSAK